MSGGDRLGDPITRQTTVVTDLIHLTFCHVDDPPMTRPDLVRLSYELLLVTFHIRDIELHATYLFSNDLL